MQTRRKDGVRSASEQHAHRMLREVIAASRAHHAHVERVSGLAAAQVRLLTVVRQHPQCTVGECSAYLGLSVPTVSNLLRDLVARKWVATVSDPADRRRLRLRLTAAGAARIRGAIPFAGGMLPSIIRRLSDDALGAVTLGMEALLAAIPSEYRAGKPAGRSASAAAVGSPSRQARARAPRRRSA